MLHPEPEQAGQALELPSFDTVEADRVLAQDELFAVVWDKYPVVATEGKRRAELMDRLRHLESRIKEAEETARECREEVRVLLDLLRRERESAGRQQG